MTSQGRRLVMPHATVTLVFGSSIAAFLLGIGSFLVHFLKGTTAPLMKNMAGQPEMLAQRAEDAVSAVSETAQWGGSYTPFLYAGLALVVIGLLTYSYWKRRN